MKYGITYNPYHASSVHPNASTGIFTFTGGLYSPSLQYELLSCTKTLLGLSKEELNEMPSPEVAACAPPLPIETMQKADAEPILTETQRLITARIKPKPPSRNERS